MDVIIARDWPLLVTKQDDSWHEFIIIFKKVSKYATLGQ